MITIATPFVGKTFCLYNYLNGLKRLDYDKSKLTMVVYDASNDEVFGRELRDEINKIGFGRVVYMKDGRPPMHDITAGNVIKSKRIASVYNRIKEAIPKNTKYIFTLEDDIEAPPSTLKTLLKRIKQDKKLGMVVGRQICRWSSNKKRHIALAWKLKRHLLFGENDTSKESSVSVLPIRIKKAGFDYIDATGMGCNLIKADLFMKEEFRPTDSGLTGFDIIFDYDLAGWGYKIGIDWGIHCKHYHIKNNGIIIYE